MEDLENTNKHPSVELQTIDLEMLQKVVEVMKPLFDGKYTGEDRIAIRYIILMLLPSLLSILMAKGLM